MKSSGAWKTALPIVLLIGTVYGFLFLEQRLGRGREPGSPSTYSSGAKGYKILYLWLEGLDVPVERWEKTLKTLPSEATVLVMLDPEFGPEPGELKGLESWVARGGTLFIASRTSNDYLSSFGMNLAGSRGEEGKNEPGFLPGPCIGGSRDIRSDGHPGLVSPRADLVVHVRDQHGALIGVVEQGKGRIIALSDPGLLSNSELRRGDHARLAVELLTCHLGQGNLLVDEYHHGYGRTASVVGHVLHSGVQGLLFQGGLLLLVLWAAAGRRFGPARPEALEKPRSSMEYVRAMAALFQRAGAGRVAYESLTRWVDEESRRLLLDKDAALQEKLRQAKVRCRTDDVTEQAVLRESRDLYAAFEQAKKRAPGG